jgi:hypothetical protein
MPRWTSLQIDSDAVTNDVCLPSLGRKLPDLTFFSVKPSCLKGMKTRKSYPHNHEFNYREKDIGIYRFERPIDRESPAEIRAAPRLIDRASRDRMTVDNF